jgi:DNA modification methylase
MIMRADARRLPLRDGCAQTCVTSPPYWGLRDYGYGAQIGLEATPDAYVASIVAVFRDVRRVLTDDGTVWLNLGDSYAAGKAGRTDYGFDPTSTLGPKRNGLPNNTRPGPVIQRCAPPGLKTKDLVGIPWRVAFALQADGWYLRADIIWSKLNPMPESVTDRPTKAHEYVFLLTKRERYYYNADAINESVADINPRRQGFTSRRAEGGMGISATGNEGKPYAEQDWRKWTRNKRSVWTVPTMPYSGAHFATMPEALVEPCILAGCPMGGLVLDPFLGSGTVGAVAERLGRRWVGTDLSYYGLSRARTRQRGLFVPDGPHPTPAII